jgi:nucleotide-binding universal stress UspA family protein
MSHSASSPVPGRPIDTIVCAIDFTLESDLACAGAADLARSFGARLLLVNVAANREEQTRARERLALYTPSWLEGVSKTALVRTGDPPHEIARLAREERAGLVVVGVQRVQPPLTPGLEDRLTALAGCPVLALRGRDDARRALDLLTGHRPGHHCAVCGRPFDSTVCPTCGARISFEAMEQKWHHELHEGPGLMGLGSARAFGPLSTTVPGAPSERLREPPTTPLVPPRRPRRWSLSRLTSFLFHRPRPS